MALERVTVRQSGSYHVGISVRDDDGSPITPAPPVTVEVLDLDGTSLSTVTASSGVGSIAAQVSLPRLGLYRLAWSAGGGREWRSSVEVCGGHFFEIHALRAVDPAYADVGRYPSDTLRRVRLTVEDRFEAVAGVAFVPRAASIRLVGDGTSRLQLPHVAVRSIRSVSVAGVQKTADEISQMKIYEWGALDLPSGSWPTGETILLTYEHGLDECPAPVSQAALIAAPEYLTRKALAARAMSEVTEFGSVDLAVAGFARPIGIPEVDRVLMDFGRRGRMVG